MTMVIDHAGSADWRSVLACVLVSVLLASAHLVIVPRLSEPEPDPDDPYIKPLYRSLVTPRFVLTALALAAAAGFAAAFTGPLRPPMVVWAAMATLITVDAVTTYLPSVLHWVAVIETVAALALSGWWSADLAGTAWRAVLGSLVLGSLFWVLWWLPQRLGRGSPLGYGDVRLMALCGAVVGPAGPSFGYLAVLLGTMAGAIYGVAVSVWRRRHPSPLGTMFAYGPGLWAGPPLAVAVQAW